MPTDKAIGIIRADRIWLAIVILALVAGYWAGVFTEKIGALEDVVFVHGVYAKVEKEATDG